MKIAKFAAVASLAAGAVQAFTPQAKGDVVRRTFGRHGGVADVACWSSASSTSTTAEDDRQSQNICDIPENVQNVRLVDQAQGGKILRNLELTAVDGSSVRLGSQMGPGTSVVVFLRHLG